MSRLLTWITGTADRRLCLALIAACALLYVPFAGNFGLWDPWETHYGEVARQMAVRGDLISLWWPGSHLDHPPVGEFWSKPVFTFWLMAASLKLFGLEWAHAAANQMVDSWRPEWALRLPGMLLGVASIWAVYELVRRLANRRAAL